VTERRTKLVHLILGKEPHGYDAFSAHKDTCC
jgi:hypothetical protein